MDTYGYKPVQLTPRDHSVASAPLGERLSTSCARVGGVEEGRLKPSFRVNMTFRQMRSITNVPSARDRRSQDVEIPTCPV